MKISLICSLIAGFCLLFSTGSLAGPLQYPQLTATPAEECGGCHKAGEERVLPWVPELKAGEYTVTSRLMYDLNRYNDRSFTEDQTEFNKTTLTIRVK